ncbi:MAG: hypothetical protein HYV07_19190 [Deltaproteobacteria bacterium]|nr:hypothetical protein [Deltaproteobacteria bacterium]
MSGIQSPHAHFRAAVTSTGTSTADPLVQDGTLDTRRAALANAAALPGPIGAEASRAVAAVNAMSAVDPLTLAMYEPQLLAVPGAQALAAQAANHAALRDHLRAQLVGVSPAQHAKTLTLMAEQSLAGGDVRGFAQLSQAISALGAVESVRAPYNAQVRTLPQYQKAQLGVTPLDEAFFDASKGFVAIAAPRLASALSSALPAQHARLGMALAAMTDDDPRRPVVEQSLAVLETHASAIKARLGTIVASTSAEDLHGLIDQTTDSAVICAHATTLADQALSPPTAPSGPIDAARFDGDVRASRFDTGYQRDLELRRFDEESRERERWDRDAESSRTERDAYARDQARYEAERRQFQADQARRDAERMAYERDAARRDAQRWEERREQERRDAARWG